jgi:hypothetical protein
MSKRKKLHISPHKNGWKVQGEGKQRPLKTFGTKQKAVKFGQKEAKKPPLGQLIIHKRDGTIQEERTYGKDPHPPKG